MIQHHKVPPVKKKNSKSKSNPKPNPKTKQKVLLHPKTQNGLVHFTLSKKWNELSVYFNELSGGISIITTYLENNADWSKFNLNQSTEVFHTDRIKAGHGISSFLLRSKIGAVKF